MKNSLFFVFLLMTVNMVFAQEYLSNPTFQQAMAELKAYPITTDPKNCLAIITTNNKLYKPVLTFEKGYSKGRDETIEEARPDPNFDKIDIKLEETGDFAKLYKNICDHDIVIKGILKKGGGGWNYGPVTYHNYSKTLKPNETIDYFKFTKGGWQDGTQYNGQYLYDSDIRTFTLTDTPQLSTSTQARTEPPSQRTLGEEQRTGQVYNFDIANGTPRDITFDLSPDGISWTQNSLRIGRGNNWKLDRPAVFFRIFTANNNEPVVYKIFSTERYVINWNANTQRWDLFKQ